MCEPVTIAIVAAGAAAAAAGVSAYGQVRAANYAQGVAQQNAKIADDQAALAEQRGAIAAGVQRMKGDQQVGEARARAGASGVDMTSGSLVDLIADARMMNELDAQTIRNNAAREAWGFKVGSVNATAEGELAALRGKYGAAATLIGGAAQAGSIYASGMRPATPPPGGTTSGALVSAPG